MASSRRLQIDRQSRAVSERARGGSYPATTKGSGLADRKHPQQSRRAGLHKKTPSVHMSGRDGRCNTRSARQKAKPVLKRGQTKWARLRG